MAHTYAHLPPNTAHTCARLTLVCAHASNHGSGVRAWHSTVACAQTDHGQHSSPRHFVGGRGACLGSAWSGHCIHHRMTAQGCLTTPAQTVTDLAKLRGQSTLCPRRTAKWYDSSCKGMMLTMVCRQLMV